MKKLSVIILSILCLTLVSVPVFADESPVDISVSINASNNNNVYLCGDPNDSNSPSCSGYSYLTVSITGAEANVTGTWTASVKMNNSLTAWYGISSANSTIKVLLPENVTFLYTSGFSYYFSQNPNAVVTFTLSASQDCPACPTCPEPQDPNRSPVMDDFHNVFINTMLSIIPITAIIFVVWFFMDLLSSLVFGRGK